MKQANITTDDVRLTVLHEHYRDTNTQVEKNVKARDRYFSLTLVLLAIMAFQLFSPQESQGVITEVVKNHLDIDNKVSITYISSLIWFTLLATVVRYFQITINLEKQYNYIHRLEDQLTKQYPQTTVFTREGVAYLKNYPLFSQWLHVVYRFIFPILFALSVSAKIVSESYEAQVSIPIIVNLIIYTMIVISTTLYMISLHKTPKDSVRR